MQYNEIPFLFYNKQLYYTVRVQYCINVDNWTLLSDDETNWKATTSICTYVLWWQAVQQNER